MDEIPTLDAAAKQAVTVRVTGVSDGDPDARQKVSVTAVSSNPALVTVKANYASTGKDPAFAGESRLALLEVTPAAGAQGEAEITVTARDDGGTAGGGTDVFARTFKVKVFPALNPAPKLDDFRLETFDGSDDAVRRIYIGGLDNGAGIPDGLGIKATSSNPALVPDPVVEYRPGDTHGFLVLSAPGAGTGEAAIAVTVTDADAKADNNGAQSATKTLAVLVRPDPVVDFVEEYNVPGDAEAIARFPETEKAHFLTLPDSDKGSLRIDVKKKFVWAGLWYQLPKEIDITDSMRISVRMRTDSATPVKCRMYLMDCHKNYSAPAPGPEVEIQSGGFQDYVFDFRGNLAGALGRPVDPSRIYRLLINFDPGKELETVVYFDDLRIGRSARSPQTQPLVTMDPVPDVFLLQGAGRQEIVVTGLGDGFDGSKTVTLTAKAANPSVVKDLKVEPMEFGRTKITFSAGGVGDSVVDLAAEALGSTPAKAAFKVVVSAGASPVDVQVNKATTFQTIEGLGAYIASPGASSITLTNPVRGAELARDLGMSLARLGIIEADWEPANDNANAMASDFPMATDPAWLESAERLAKFKRLSGVDRYIMSVWAPGAFMMHLKGRSCFSAMALQGSTPDTYPFTLNPAYLDEFTEHLSAWHHWLSERAGIDLYATSLGNEIQFTQTYPSAVYGIGYYHRVWRALGKRLEKEGLPPWQFGAEILPAQHEVLAYMRPLIEDPDSAKYIRALAYHGYVGLGVDPGSGDARQLASFHDEMSKIGKGVWMTETSGNSDDWKGAYELGEAMFACLTTGRNAAWVFWTFANNTDEGGYLLANRWTPGGRFYAVKQMMKHIRPGDVMLDATSGDSSVTPAVFRSAEGGRMVLVLKNGAAEMKPVKVPDLGGPADVYQSAEYRHHVYLGQCKSGATILLPPHSFTTLVSAPAPGGTAEEPVLYPRHASTGTPLRVQVTTPTDGAVIRYTTDGSVPVESSPAASNPLMLTKDTLLKVRAFRPGMEPSPVGGAYYQFAGE
jgi:O-glycosyl hydrolase